MFRTTLAVLLLAAAAPALAAGVPDPATTYKVVTDGSSRTLEVGKKGKVVVDVVPLEKGIHVNREFPLKYKVEPSAGLRVDKVEWKRTDAVDPGADNPRFEIPVTAAAKGGQSVTVQMRFAICSDAWCVPQTRTVTVPIDVK
ncbi:MAG TPA: hypothetical protein VFM53_09340 [Anaeromyxobacteraceae bacterium]|nr:hypothetical protein [Anaeromyxobacteraceae bacterium]